MPHFFIKAKQAVDGQILIDDAENYRHIAKSLRAKTGEKLLLIDENELQYETTISSITNHEIFAKIDKTYKSHRKLKLNLYLAQAPLKSEAQLVIMEKATELGIAGIYPILTDNCALNKSVIEKKTPKWQRVMYEASKQCERANIPECYNLTSIDNLIKNENFDFVLAFCERLSSKNLKQFYNENTDLFCNDSRILVIIGPEGGFSQREFDYFKNNNIPMLTLGDLILKAETAVITALGNIIYEYNNSVKN